MYDAQVIPFTPNPYFYAVYDTHSRRLVCAVSLFRLALDYYEKGFVIVYKNKLADMPIYLNNEEHWCPKNAEVIPFVTALQKRIEQLR